MVKWIKEHATQIDLAIFIPCGIIGLLAILCGQVAGGALIAFAIWRLGRLLLLSMLR